MSCGRAAVASCSTLHRTSCRCGLNRWLVGRLPLKINDRDLQLGLAPNGRSTYYSADFTEEDAELLNRFIKAQVPLV